MSGGLWVGGWWVVGGECRVMDDGLRVMGGEGSRGSARSIQSLSTAEPFFRVLFLGGTQLPFELWIGRAAPLVFQKLSGCRRLCC